MATIDWLADQLRKDPYIDVLGIPGWKGRTRPGAFAPRGVLIHHTAFPSSADNPAPAQDTVVNGRGGPQPLPGPLCHVLLDRNGTCRLVAAGRANHAGVATAQGPMPAGDGNTMYVGIEIDYAPQAPYDQSPSEAQLVTAVNATAAILARLGNGASYVRYHKNTSTTGKIDPANFPDGNTFREMVQAVLKDRWR